MKAYILLVLLSLVSVGCASNPRTPGDSAGSWFSKEGAFPEDRTSRRLLIAELRSEATDIHGVRRIEQATRNADGAYVVRFPYDASLYDAYRIQKLTDTTFEYRHVVQGALERETKVGPPPPRDRMREGMAVSVCEGKAI